jgi:hypothetical protein
MESRYGSISQNSNPIAEAGQKVMGKNFKEEAHQEFATQQGERIRAAGSFEDALKEAAPTIQVEYGQIKWPKRTLAMLYAIAKAKGDLDKPLTSMMPKAPERYGYRSDLLDRRLFTVKSRGSQDENVRDRTAGNALQALAAGNGYYDLAAAIAIQSNPAPQALAQIADLPLDQQGVIDAIAHVVQKHPELAEQPVSNFMTSWAIRNKLGHGYDDLKMGDLPDALRPKEAA